MLSNNNESDLDDVVLEVKVKQKPSKPNDSDEETIVISSKPPKKTSSNMTSAPVASKKSNNFLQENSSKGKDESITDTDDEARLAHPRRPKGKEELTVKPSNITNIINNNNINNYIINDPNKAPQFLNSHS